MCTLKDSVDWEVWWRRRHVLSYQSVPSLTAGDLLLSCSRPSSTFLGYRGQWLSRTQGGGRYNLLWYNYHLLVIFLAQHRLEILHDFQGTVVARVDLASLEMVQSRSELSTYLVQRCLSVSLYGFDEFSFSQFSWMVSCLKCGGSVSMVIHFTCRNILTEFPFYCSTQLGFPVS